MGKKPAIRFEGYTEDWEQRELGNVCKITMGQSPDGSTYSDTPSDFILVQGNADLKDGWVCPRIWTTQKTKTADAGDLIMSVRAPAGAMGKTAYDVVLGRGVAGIKGNELIYQLLVKMDSEGYWKKLAAGSTFESINSDTITNAEIVIPQDIEEQETIGTYFRNLDHLITLHQSNYEKMISTKKSMLDRLFPQGEAKVPAIRFEGFEDDWEKKPLSAIVIPYSDPVEVPHNGYERLGIRSHGKGVFHEYVEAGKEITTAQLHRVAAHNFIVNITFAWEHAVAVTSDEDAGKLVSHRFPQFSMADGIYDQFLKYMILDARFHHHLLLSSPGGAGRNRVLKIPEMLEYEMRIPDIEEQKQIAGYLNSLDNLIELYRIRVEKLKDIKAACLQGMFV